jgi:hypothetical protein
MRSKNDWLDYLEHSALCHYGVIGMHWGIRRYQPYSTVPRKSGKGVKEIGLSNDFANNLSATMQKTIKYSDFTRLKSAKEVEQSRSGSCHDQVMYEYQKLKAAGYKPKARFLIEYDPKTGMGGTTHSFVYYKDGKDTVWFENAWGGKEGIHKRDSIQAIQKEIKRYHSSGEFGDHNKYSKIEFSDFKPERQKVGSSLQDVVDVALSDDRNNR